jgi:hypothetical protein
MHQWRARPAANPVLTAATAPGPYDRCAQYTPFRADHVGSLLRPPQPLATREDCGSGRIDVGPGTSRPPSSA